MALKLPVKRYTDAVVFMAEDARQAREVYQHALNMSDARGPLNGVGIVLVPPEMKANDVGDYVARANDFKKQSTLVIAISPEVKVKKGMLRGSETVALEDVLGLKELPQLSEGEIWGAGYDARDELDLGQKVVAATQKALGSKGAKGGTLGVSNTNEHEENPDKVRDGKWSTLETHTGEKRGDGDLNDWALKRRRSEEGGKGGGGHRF